MTKMKQIKATIFFFDKNGMSFQVLNLIIFDHRIEIMIAKVPILTQDHSFKFWSIQEQKAGTMHFFITTHHHQQEQETE